MYHEQNRTDFRHGREVLASPKKDTEKALTAALETIAAALAAGDRVQPAGFGTFWYQGPGGAAPAAYPSTGEPMDIPADRLPAFKAGKALKDAAALATQSRRRMRPPAFLTGTGGAWAPQKKGETIVRLDKFL